jgi:hypothetical protein
MMEVFYPSPYLEEQVPVYIAFRNQTRPLVREDTQ